MSERADFRLLRLETEGQVEPEVELRGVDAWFGDAHILRGVQCRFQSGRINCIIGPSGSGKSTLIRCINRINEETPGFFLQGRILFRGRDIYQRAVDPVRLRAEIGMVFQKPCVFPRSIQENVLFGVERLARLSRQEKLRLVEENLRAASLWKEVQDRLGAPAHSLSLGQQQRLCLARTLAVRPKVILLDEPTSSLDPASTQAIEKLMLRLRESYTIIFVTHDLRQAHRIADSVLFLCEGRVIESGPAELFFASPQREETRKYLSEGYCEC